MIEQGQGHVAVVVSIRQRGVRLLGLIRKDNLINADVAPAAFAFVHNAQLRQLAFVIVNVKTLAFHLILVVPRKLADDLAVNQQLQRRL